MKNLDSVPVIKLINKKPVKFFKKLKTIYRSEDFISGLIPELYKEKEYFWIEVLESYIYKGDPVKGSRVGNILRVLRKHYPSLKYEYRGVDYIEVANYIHIIYGKRIDRYMKKQWNKGKFEKMDEPFLTKDTAFREQVARGFVIRNDYDRDNKDAYFVKSTLYPNLVYPQVFKTFEEAYKKRDKIGIEGYTGIHQPKK
jgi:hypothetical protein